MNDVHGWTAVPRSLEKLVASRKDKKPSQPIRIEDISTPNSQIVQDVMKYAQARLPAEAFNHSMRVYYFGIASPAFSLFGTIC